MIRIFCAGRIPHCIVRFTEAKTLVRVSISAARLDSPG